MTNQQLAIQFFLQISVILVACRVMGEVMARHHADLMARHPSVGAVRNIGLFGMIDVVRSRDPFEPMAPYNGTSDEMKAIAKYCRDNGLYTMYRWNGIHTNPPLTITEEQLAEGFAIIDKALEISDHLPVWAEFSIYEGGKPGYVAGRTDGRP